MTTRIKNARLLLPEGLEEGKYLYFSDGVITTVTAEELPFDTEIDAAGLYAAPGFIDLHVHGGGGADFTEDGEEDILHAIDHHAYHGTTTIYPSTVAASCETLCGALRRLRHAIQSGRALANVPGVHLEGPYFSPAQCGAQNTDFITPPVPEDYEKLLAEYGDILKRWSFAPELPGSQAFLQRIHAAGVVSSMGHTNAKYEDVLMACEEGCRLITHFYSCISTITREKGYRKLGVMECGYLMDDLDVEAIADGCHIPAELFRLLYKIKGAEHICLVTDALRCCGNEGEHSSVGGVACVIKNGVAVLPDESAFAGSIATTDRLVRFCVQQVGIPLEEAVRMASANPARVMGLTAKGRLAPGCDADIVCFDDNINVKKVIVMGRTIREDV